MKSSQDHSVFNNRRLSTLSNLLRICYDISQNFELKMKMFTKSNMVIKIFQYSLVQGLFALVPTQDNKVAVVPFLGQNQHVYM